MAEPDKKEFIAHVKQADSGEFIIHHLAEHLQSVAQLSAASASEFGNSDWAYLAGLWHDLGKYSQEFQKRIKTNSGYDADAYLEGMVGRVDHSTAGALHAIDKLKFGRVLAYLIAGHHAGLPDWHSSETGGAALSIRLQKAELLQSALASSPPTHILNQNEPTTKPPGRSAALWLRMLFSCLVDADFLDTESFMDSERTQSRSSYPSLEKLQEILDNFLVVKTAQSPKTKVNGVRQEILKQCLDKSGLPSGLFSLTVPTGGGKTLSSLAFAMRHAVHHGKKRIIYVIPYTSIIEQTADVFRKIFGDVVVEHHSNLESDKESARSRLACENWDAPIIVTTNVQFFESLFAARTSRTRKLHNIVNSVVILDEAQLLPIDLLKPVLNILQELADAYKTSCVLCTATQPAFDAQQGFGWNFPGLKNVRELMDDPIALHDQLKRIRIKLPTDYSKLQTWEEIAAELQTKPSVLCVVNRRDDCRTLFQLMPKGTFHLSALMCGEHRSRSLKAIKNSLSNGEPTRVISTQLVEAGVDVDFPVVYRAMAGLDSIAQAAGRCNREGLLEQGEVVVFVPPKPAPMGILRKAEDTARQMLQQGLKEPLSPDSFKEYFKQLYWKANDLDKHGILKLLESGSNFEIQFRTAAEKFQLIDSKQQASLIVLYQESDQLIAMLKKNGPARWLMRKLQRYTINIPRSLHNQLTAIGDITEVYSGIFAQSYASLYHPDLGFLGGDMRYADPNDFVV